MASHQLEHFDPEQNTAVLSLDAGLYPVDVIYGAAYAFIDRAYVLLDKHPKTDSRSARYEVRMRGKAKLDEAGVAALSGEFGNELLSQALRRKVVRANNTVIEEIVTQAIAGATGAGLPQDFVDDDDDDLDFLDDPLGIAVPWEEKFKKERSDGGSDSKSDG